MRTITISSVLSCALLLLAVLLHLAVEHRRRGEEISRMSRGFDVLAQRLQTTEVELEGLRALAEAIQASAPAVAGAERAFGASAPAASSAGALAQPVAARSGPENEEGWVSIEQRLAALDSRAEELAARIGAISDSFESLQAPVVSVINMAAEDDGSDVQLDGNDVIDVRFGTPASIE
jgi:hypothetical protein